MKFSDRKIVLVLNIDHASSFLEAGREAERCTRNVILEGPLKAPQHYERSSSMSRTVMDYW